MIVPATEVRIVMTTAGTREEAEDIARNLVDARLAACVSVVPGLSSIYRWKGEVEATSENLLIIKTTAAKLDGVETARASCIRMKFLNFSFSLRKLPANRILTGCFLKPAITPDAMPAPMRGD